MRVRIDAKILAFLICSIWIFGCSQKPYRDVLKLDQKVITIDKGASRLGPCEPSICINPENPNEVFAGAVLNHAYRSLDGGKTWEKNKLKSSYGVYGDPVVKVTKGGRVLYCHLADPKNNPYRSKEFLDRIVVQSSSDHGRSWTDGAFPPCNHEKDQDKPWLYCSPNDSNLVLMAWTEFDKYGSSDKNDKSRILFSQSQDGGLSWSEGKVISTYEGDCLDGDRTTEGAPPVVGVDGTYYVVWAYDDSLYLNMSKDKGVTWLEAERAVAPQKGGWAYEIPGIGRANGMPVILCDHSQGPRNGYLYISWSDQSSGEDDTDVWMIASFDKGVTWTEKKRVNDDEKGHHQFFSWMDIDQSNGDLYWVFYDRRNHKDVSTDVFLARSVDGGKTFSNYIISDAPFIPQSNVFFGDYNDISVHHGMVRPIWTRLDETILSVQTSLIQF
ncbi:MAG: glycosyl hydrolase [Saprospiraceae bacterium]|nr:glycosyl hydrolase [Saprospiraceae bacterium]MCB9310694.1 glycosyl hydrolase [Lewinellaceae bacterium]